MGLTTGPNPSSPTPLKLNGPASSWPSSGARYRSCIIGCSRNRLKESSGEMTLRYERRLPVGLWAHGDAPHQTTHAGTDLAVTLVLAEVGLFSVELFEQPFIAGIDVGEIVDKNITFKLVL